MLQKRGNGIGNGGGRHSGGGESDPGLAYAPDPRFGVADTAFPPAAAATSVVASTGASSSTFESGGFASGGAPPTSGDPFPTTGRALALLGGHALAGFGILMLLLSAKPAGHHQAHVGNGSIGLLGFVIAFVGASFSVPATARVQRDVMGGGWNSRLALGYISPQISLYVMSPSGISDAARRLNIAPGLAMLVIYGLGVSDVLLMAAHYFGH